MIDIYHSRRAMFRKCYYYNRDETATYDLSEWVLNKKPSGSFYVKEITPKTNQEQQVNNVMMFDRHTITLLTNDKIDDIRKGSVVKYLNQLWLVNNIQFVLHRKESEYSTDEFTTYLYLTRNE